MTSAYQVRPRVQGCVVGLGLGKFRFVGSGVGLVLAALLPSMFASVSLAGPTGGKVVAGNASITQHGNRTIIRAGDGSIINYSSFNLTPNESVKFIQPGSTSRVLNRISGDAPSTLNGTITANGIVYFANPAGVIFGPNSVINVGGIYAAAGNISNRDFAAGLDHFTNVHGDVTNAGQIDAKFAALVGERIANTGSIQSADGMIALVSGNEVTLSPRGSTISVKINSSSIPAPTSASGQAAIENSGTLSADRGSAFMVAGDLYSLAVKNTGNVRARNITVAGRGSAGVQVSGKLDASNQVDGDKGGTIQVTGKTVDLAGADINASGRYAGGEILIGGDFQGGGSLRRATDTAVDSGTTINADANVAGNGGKVIVWSDHTTTFLGTISASGGVKSGDGGLVETSGKINLDIEGASIQARARSASGKAGLWMMDPVNVNIDSAPDNGTTNSSSGGTTTYSPDNSVTPAVVDVATINAALNGGTNVTVITGAVGSDAGNITVSAPINKTMGGDATFTLRAANNVVVNSTIGSTAGKLNVSLQADASGGGNVDTNVGVGDVTINAAITTNGGTFSSSGVGYTQAVGGTIATAGGNVSIQHTGIVAVNDTLNAGGAANVLIEGSTFAASAAVTGGSGGINLQPANTASDIRLNNGAGDFNLSSTTLGNLALPSGATLTIGASGGTGTVLIGSSGDIDLSGLDADLLIQGAIVRFNGALTFAGTRTLTLTTQGVQDNHSGTDVTGGTLDLNLASGTASLGTSVATLGTSNVAGDLTIDNATDLSVGNLTVGGNLDMRASGTITGTSDMAITGTSLFLTRKTGGADITVGSAASTFGGALTTRSRNNADTADDAGAIDVTAQSGITLAQVATTGAFTLTTAGDVGATGVVKTGAASITAGGTTNGDIAISQLQASGPVTITNNAGGNVTLTNNQGITIDSASSIGGNLTLTAATGNIDVQTTDVQGTNVTLTTQASNATIQTASLSGAKTFMLTTSGPMGDADIASDGLMTVTSNVTGTLTFTGGAGVTIASVPTLNLGASSAAGFVTITAPEVNITGAISAGSAGIILEPDADAKTIGINSAGSDFSVSLAELLDLTTTGTVTIGRSTGTGATTIGGLGPVDLSSTTYSLALRGGQAVFEDVLTLPDDSLLTLHTAGVANPSSGTAVVIGGMNGAVAIDSTAAVDLSTQVAQIAARTTTGGITLSNTGTLEITNVGGIAGVQAAGGDVTISATGDLKLTDAVSTTGTGEVSLSATAGSVDFGTGATASTGTGTVAVFASDSIGASSDPMAQITAGTVSLTAISGDIGAGNVLRIDTSFLNATAGGNATLENMGSGTLDASISGGSTSVVSLTHQGLLSIGAGHSITAGYTINIVAGDLDVLGELNSGNSINISRPLQGTIGVGDATGDMMISKTDLSHMVAATLNIGGANTTGITVDNVAEADVSRIGAINLNALANGANITFSGSRSTLHDLTATADDSINVNIDLVSSLGGLRLFADADSMPDMGGDKINVGGGITISTSLPNGGDITLMATGGIVGSGSFTLDSNGAITLNSAVSAMGDLTLHAKGGISLNGAGSGATVNITANDGVTIADDLTTSSALSIDADHNADGMGLFSLAAGKTIRTGGNALTINAADVVIDGNIDVGASTVAIARDSSGTIGLGTASGDMQISGAELSHITAAGLALGSNLCTTMNVDSVAAGDTANIANLITILADDLNITGQFNTSSASLAIGRGTVDDIDVGTFTTTTGMNISNAELALIFAPSLQIGGGSTNNIFVGGVTTPDTANIAGTVTFQANGTITFGQSASTFKSLAVNAENGIHVNKNLSTTVGDMVMDGDSDGVPDPTSSDDAITIGSGVTLDAAGMMSLKATTHGLAGNGSLTLNAGNGITLFNDLIASGDVLIDADHNADNMGTLVVSAGRTISTSGSNLTISAADLTLDGSIASGVGSTTITRSAPGTIGIGMATGDMSISGDELGRIIATGLTIGGPTITGITVDGVTSTNSNGISGTTTLIAGSGNINFTDTASVFNQLDARASGGITVGVALSTDLGTLRLDGNSDGVGNDAITLSAGLTADMPVASGSAPTTAFNIDLASNVLLGANTIIIGKDIKFEGKIDSATTSSEALTCNTFNSGVTTFTGDVGSTHPLAALATNNDGLTQIGGNITTTANIGFLDPVKLLRDSVITEIAGLGIMFDSTVDTANSSSTPRSLTVLVQRSTNAGATTYPIISFSGAVGSIKPLRNLFLNYDGTAAGNGRANVPGAATIIARPRDSSGNVVTPPTTPYDMTFNLLGTFRMGNNEKLTADGSLTINAPTGAFLGDLNAIGDLTVNSPHIRLLRRSGGLLLGNQGVDGADSGLDFVSGGNIDFTSVPVAVGTGENPRFGTVDGGGDTGNTLAGFVFQAFGPITSDLINSGGSTLITLDLKSSGPTNTNIADTIAGAIPRESRQNDVSENITVSQALFEQVKQLGIVPRNPTAAELVELLTGSATYDDFPRTNPPTAEDYTTVVNRLPSDSVNRLLDSYDEVFNKPMLDDSGKPVLDTKGKTRRVSRTQEIQDALLASVRRYRDASKAHPGAAGTSTDIDPSAFRAYLEENEQEAVSLGYIRQLNTFLNRLDHVGLTARELNQSKAIILNPVRPRGIRTIQQFEAIIRAEPSRAMR